MWALATWTGEQERSGAVRGHPAAHRPGYMVRRTDLPRSLRGDKEVWKTRGYTGSQAKGNKKLRSHYKTMKITSEKAPSEAGRRCKGCAIVIINKPSV
ncbi:hypothetical protein AV530_016915 [Patagioenas fasciata monilis]|uniref:Uncharacterized protein n=1 Tax=Patagioenas fasciata monilis TaxID=372326 RepID=A0A1V4J4P7_PATFA|nr:hypothetical protein AV530_016915 [Patagioenas fasciata monilis]